MTQARQPVGLGRRARSLEEVGIKVLRYPAAEVLADPDAIAAAIFAEMKQRYDILEIVTRMTFSRQGVHAETLATPTGGAGQ